MKSILETALVHLLNEDNDKAEELLHQYVIQKAREIHESLREEDEDVEDEEMIEENSFFTEDDLVDAEEEEATADLSDDLGEELPEIAGEEDLSDDTLDGEMEDTDFGAEVEGEGEGEGDIEAELSDFEDKLAALQAEFDEMLADVEGSEAVADEDAEGEFDADAFGAEEVADDSMEGDMGAVEGEEEEEDFDDITESVIDELQKVSAETSEGKGTNGEDLLGNKQSLKFTKPAPKPATSTKNVGHTGYAREDAPKSEPTKGGKTVVSSKMRNVRADADAGNHAAKNEGPKAALRAKPTKEVPSTVSGKPLGKK